MSRIAFALLALASFPALAADPPATRAAKPADVLIAADLAFGRDAAARGLPGWMDWFAEDSAVFPTDAPPATGKAAVRAYYERIRFDPRNLAWTPVRAELAASGEVGYTWGTWTWTAKGPDGKSTSATGKYMTIWRRQPDGSYKVEADIGAPDR